MKNLSEAPVRKERISRKMLAPGVAKVLKRLHFQLDVILRRVRWYVAYSLSLRDLER
jgi:putative transposase